MGLGLLLGLMSFVACTCEESAPPSQSVLSGRGIVENPADADVNGVPLEREEIRYIITIIPPSMKKAPARLSSLLNRLGIEHKEEISADKDNAIDIPRDFYLEFVDRLQKHGRLRVERQRFMTGSSSNAPVPFVIRFSETYPDSKQN
jgi:hypothetical protein